MQNKETIEVPEGVDISEAITIPEEISAFDFTVVNTEEDLLNLTVRRIVELPQDDPIYEAIIDGLGKRAKASWLKREDFEVLKLYVKHYPNEVFKHFDDLNQTRIRIARQKLDELRKQRRKSKRS